MAAQSATPTFLENFKREIEKLENISTEFLAPTFWYDTGNYALNKVLSGSYYKAIPQGRITCLCGPSAVGKSFIVCNILREAQKQDCYTLVLDSENALDPDFMQRAGIDVSGERLTYIQVVTIQDVTTILSEFFKGYEKEYGRFNKNSPKILIILDSLGNCLTDSENEKFNKGVQTGDQGQSAKMKKHLLRTLVSRLPRFNATMVITDQVYPADPMAGDGVWAITNGVKYSASQIALLTKLKLKEGDDIIGIRMKVETYKSRFVKPGTKITLRIPFATGLSRIEGLLDYFIEDGTVTTSGAWMSAQIDGVTKKFQRPDFTEEFALKLLNTNAEVKKGEELFAELQSSSELFEPEVELDQVDQERSEETLTSKTDE